MPSSALSGSLTSDEIVFVADDPTPPEYADGCNSRRSWKVLLVDDEESVHRATGVALRFFTFEEQPLELISAYSGAEGKQMMAQHPDTVLVLLDVIMETPNAGLELAAYIREELGNQTVRIVLSTGQPGQVPEESVVLDYDINDYKTKVELTQKKLFTTLVSSFRAYRDLTALEESKAELASVNAQLQTLNQTLEQRVRDRTESLEQEAKVRQQAQAALKLYLHALAHDLRNPITGIKTLLESLLSRSDRPDGIVMDTAIAVRMAEGCDRQLHMIDSLLDTHAIEIGGVPLQRSPFDIAILMRAVAADWQSSCQKKRISIQLELSPDLPLVDGDRAQLRRVFDNLMDNALKYNPPEIQLKLSAQPVVNSEASPMIRCAVSDTGVGIDPAQQATLFDPYHRGAEVRVAHRGFGLGLYVCQRIVAAHNGQMQVNSELGGGTEFWFTVPVAANP